MSTLVYAGSAWKCTRSFAGKRFIADMRAGLMMVLACTAYLTHKLCLLRTEDFSAQNLLHRGQHRLGQTLIRVSSVGPALESSSCKGDFVVHGKKSG